MGKKYGKCAKEVDTIGSAIDAKMKPVLSIEKGKTSAPFWKCDSSKIEAQLKSCTYSPLPGDMGPFTLTHMTLDLKNCLSADKRDLK